MEPELKKQILKNCHIVKIPRDGELHNEWNQVHELLEGYVTCLYGDVNLQKPLPHHVVVYFPKDINAEGMYVQKRKDEHAELLREKTRKLFQRIYKEGEVLIKMPT